MIASNKTQTKPLLYTLFGIVVFISLVYYNYLQARKNLSSRPSQFSIELINPPFQTESKIATPFTWKVDTDSDFKTQLTSLYYSPISSPGALTTYDSPEAVNYPYHLPDYERGQFQLPDSFDANIYFSSPGTYFLRAYARINGNHYWSNEYTLNVR